MDAKDLSIQVESDGRIVATRPVSPTACYEDALFRSVIDGLLPNDGRMPSFELGVTWSACGPPFASALSLCHAGLPTYHYPREVFAPQARHAIRALAQQGELSAETPAAWRLLVEFRPGVEAKVRRAPFPFEVDSLPAVAGAAFAVEIEADLLDVIQQRVVAAGATERAAMLLGRLLHDPERRVAVVRISAEIPLEVGAGGASQGHFSFDPASFVRVRREAALREDGLVPVGWIHSHPGCANCLDQPSCPAETVFFSSSDVEVHTAAFPSPYMVGLVAGKLRHLPARRPGFRLFGWAGAEVVPLPFTVIGAAADAFRAEVLPAAQPEVRP